MKNIKRKVSLLKKLMQAELLLTDCLAEARAARDRGEETKYAIDTIKDSKENLEKLINTLCNEE